MLRALALLAITLFALHGFIGLLKTPKDNPIKRLQHFSSFFVSLIALLLLTGSLYVLGIIILVTTLFARRLLPLVINLHPLYSQYRKNAEQETPYNAENNGYRPHSHEEVTRTPSAQLDEKTARSILGLTEIIPTREMIIQAHRRMIQKNHPDRGGSEFIAAQINQAKDFLLKRHG